MFLYLNVVNTECVSNCALYTAVLFTQLSRKALLNDADSDDEFLGSGDVSDNYSAQETADSEGFADSSSSVSGSSSSGSSSSGSESASDSEGDSSEEDEQTRKHNTNNHATSYCCYC
jgi:hypothetical protein